MRRPSAAAEDRALAQSLASIRASRRQSHGVVASSRKPAARRVPLAPCVTPAKAGHTGNGAGVTRRQPVKITAIALDGTAISTVFEAIEQQLLAARIKAVVQAEPVGNPMLLRAALREMVEAFSDLPWGHSSEQGRALEKAALALDVEDRARADETLPRPRYT